jgi:hypothetical protein
MIRIVVTGPRRRFAEVRTGWPHLPAVEAVADELADRANMDTPAVAVHELGGGRVRLEVAGWSMEEPRRLGRFTRRLGRVGLGVSVTTP